MGLTSQNDMAADDAWCASALCRSETLLALHRLAVTPSQHERMWGRLRDDWDAFVVALDSLHASPAAPTVPSRPTRAAESAVIAHARP